MAAGFAPVPDVALHRGLACAEPRPADADIDLESPAISVMTDFTTIQPRCAPLRMPIDAALEAMRTAGVRLLLVLDGDNAVVGLITAYDILGEAPVRVAAESGTKHADLRVEQLMTPCAEIRALDLRAVEEAQVGNVVETLRRLDQSHVLVVESESGGRVRGLFSATEVGRRLRVHIGDVESRARSFAHLSRELL